MSSSLPKKIKPVNRHLSICPHFREEKEEFAGVLLPDGFEKPEDKYILATVLDIASDCSSTVKEVRISEREQQMVVVDRAMIEEIAIFNKTYYLVLENYVVGIVKNFSEN